MQIFASIMIGLVALEHVYILILEMFLWTKPRGRKVFRMSVEQAEQTKVLAANQGLYNGFLALGLLWSLLHPSAFTGREIAVFFLACVLMAAIYGGMTVGRKILFVQGAPALVALIATWLWTP